tara:strand:+ start:390 stop:2441 length:2052 start_codon:yes stop_codon:yes gene_type:complete
MNLIVVVIVFIVIMLYLVITESNSSPLPSGGVGGFPSPSPSGGNQPGGFPSPSPSGGFPSPSPTGVGGSPSPSPSPSGGSQPGGFPSPSPSPSGGAEFIQLFGTGWELIKSIPGDSNKWFPGNDNLQGYPGDEFLFTTGDYSKWLIADHDQVSGDYYDLANREIKRSSVNPSPYTAEWLFDDGSNFGFQTPQLYIGDGSSNPAGRTDDRLMYAENRTGSYLDGIHPSGMYVYTRTSPTGVGVSQPGGFPSPSPSPSGGYPGIVKSLEMAQIPSQLQPNYNTDKTELEITGDSKYWYTCTTTETLVTTETVGKMYEFELDMSSNTGHLILGFSTIGAPGTQWNNGAGSHTWTMLLEYYLANNPNGLHRHDWAHTYQTGTEFINDSEFAKYWRFTVVENLSEANDYSYHDIKYEGFADEARTQPVLRGLASRMHHGASELINTGETFFNNNSQFHLRFGTFTGEFTLKNFVDIIPFSDKYRIKMRSLVQNEFPGQNFRGTELAFVGRYLESTQEYIAHANYNYNADNGFVILNDGDTEQYGDIDVFPDSEGFRSFTIQFPGPIQLSQIYVGSADSTPDNNFRSFDERIVIEYWHSDPANNSGWRPHSEIVWATLPDADGNVKQVNGYFPWQPAENRTSALQKYPLIGMRGKQILRYDGQKWYHYKAYGNDNFTEYPKEWNGETVY